MDIAPLILMWIIVLFVWDGIWKGVGMWHAARNGHLGWFICILIFNTIGLLPIIYFLFFRTTEKTEKNSI